MKGYPFAFLMLSLGLLIPLSALIAEEETGKKTDPKAKQEAASEEQSSNASLPVYIPPAPKQPTPGTRTGSGATRGEQTALPTVTLLVPEHVAHTAKTQPTLYWHLDKDTGKQVVLTLTAKAAKPLLELPLPKPLPSGLHALPLSAHGIYLEEGKTYEWSVSIRQNPETPSSDDLVARGFIIHTAPSAELQELTAADPLSQARAYAKAGIWYESLAALSQENANQGTKEALRQARTQLLAQVGLGSLLH